MTANTHPAPPPVVALVAVYEVKNFDHGDTFTIYAPADHDPAELFTVAHVNGPAHTPTVCLVDADSIGGYTVGALRVMANRHPDAEIVVCTNTTSGALREALPR